MYISIMYMYTIRMHELLRSKRSHHTPLACSLLTRTCIKSSNCSRSLQLRTCARVLLVRTRKYVGVVVALQQGQLTLGTGRVRAIQAFDWQLLLLAKNEPAAFSGTKPHDALHTRTHATCSTVTDA